MTLEQVKEISAAIGERTPEELVKAANIALKHSGTDQRVDDAGIADTLLRQIVQTFLDDDNYLFAGCLMLPSRLFNPDIQYAKDMVVSYTSCRQLLFMGANGTGKSWQLSVLAFLDWRRDPFFTMIKMAAVNENHLKGTLIANVSRLCEDCHFPIPIEENDMEVRAKGSHKDMGICGVLFPNGNAPSGRIRGYRPKPIRKEPHPKFGYMSRSRFMGDEAQFFSEGVFKDFGSLQSAMSGPDPVKIIMCFNPIGPDVEVVRLAMPHQGWKIEDIDILYKWKSRRGWDVLRLDGALSENVKARKIVYDGIQTFDGYMGFVSGSSGAEAEYYEKARGWVPVKGAVNIVISSELLGRCRGNLNFIGKVLNLAHLDCAYQGEDSPILTISRYGMANYVLTESGDRKWFMDYLNPEQKKPRRCFQADQQFKLPNTNPTELAEEVMRICKELGIPPDNVVVDGSGNGFGTYSHLAKYWGNVLYIQWGRKSTDLKVLHEDQEPASAVYDNIISEMWFTMRRWMESGCFWISTTIHPSPMAEQLTTRRFNRIRGSLLRVEAKPEFKSRGNPSPDEADSLIQGPHLIRERFYHLLPGMQVDAQYTEEVRDKWAEKDEDYASEKPDHLEEGAGESSKHLD
jgi:hypothetical protein